MKTPQKGDIWKYNRSGNIFVHFLFVECKGQYTSGEEFWNVLEIEAGVQRNIAWWPNRKLFKKVA